MSTVLSFKNWVRINESNKFTFVSEQLASYWDEVKGLGDNPNGKKQVVKEFASSNPLTFPGKGQLSFKDDKLPVYVGAYLQAHYSPLVKKVESPSYNLSAPFGYELDFFLADKQGSTGWPNNRPAQAEYFRVKCAQLKNGKFQILTVPSFSPEFKVRKMDVQGGGADGSVEKTLSMTLKDLDSWMGTLRKDVNTELAKMGFPAVPNSLKWQGIQDV